MKGKKGASFPSGVNRKKGGGVGNREVDPEYPHHPQRITHSTGGGGTKPVTLSLKDRGGTARSSLSLSLISALKERNVIGGGWGGGEKAKEGRVQ